MAREPDLEFNINVKATGLSELQQTTKAVKRVEDRMKAGARSVNQYAAAHNKSGRSVQKFSMGVLQQAGYQIGDYAVQVANGTSKMQAFGQQGAQLLGVFGPIGAVLGAGVAIFSAVAVAIQKTSEATDSAKESVDLYIETLKRLEDQYRKTDLEQEMFARGLTDMDQTVLVKGLERAQEKLKEAQEAVDALPAKGSQAAAMRGFEILEALGKQKAALDEVADAEKALAEFREDRAQALQLEHERREAEKLLPALDYQDAILRSIALKNADNAAYARELLAAREAENKTMDEYVRSRDQAASMAAAEARAQNASLAAMAQYVRLRTLNQTAMTAGDRAAQRLTAELQSQTNIMNTQMKYGKESAEVYILQLEAASNALKERLKAQGASESEINKALEALSNNLLAQKELSAAVDTTVSSFAKMPEVIQEVDPALQAIQERTEQIANSISGSFESAFMSMVDGTQSAKEAFRSLSRDIIGELYRVFIVKRITGFIGDFVSDPAMFGGGSGPIGSVRPNARSFNGGGYTGNGARAGGLDGRGGFMAMIHPRETVVDHTKGQGQGVTIVQNNNFGDGVSRSEVQQMIPAIVQATKAAVFDAQRRSVNGRGYA